MKIALLFLILIATFSCKEVETEIPICIQDILDNDTTNHAPIVKVLVQIEKGEQHYWLNTDIRHSDGVEYIVNNECDTVCSFCGECIPKKCIKKYKEKKWVQIWE